MNSSINIQVLGSGCPTCRKLLGLTEEAVSRLGLDTTVQYVTDFGKIAALGVISLPALVIDGQIVLAGRLPAPEELEKLIMPAKA